MTRASALFSVSLICTLLVLPAVGQEPASQTDASNENGSGTSELLSAQSLDALTAGIALYPDKTVEQALAAASKPQQIAAAAQLSPEQFQEQSGQFDASIQYLEANAPQLLTQLNQHLSLTTTLGIAAQTQLNDVWASVDRVRAQYQQSTNNSQTNDSQTEGSSADSSSASGNEASQESSETAPTYNTYNDNSTTTTGYAGGAGYGATGAFAAGLVAGNAYQDLYRGRPYYPANRLYNGNNPAIDHRDNEINPADRVGPNTIGHATGVGGIGGVTGAGGVNGIGGVGGVGGAGGVNGIGGVNGVGSLNTARPAGVNGGNHDWVNGVGNGERQNMADNTWGHMDNQAHESFTGRNASPVNTPNAARPGSNQGFDNGNRNFGRNGGAGINTGRPNSGPNSGLQSSQFGGFGGPSQGKLSPNNPSQPRNSAGPSHNPSPSRSFGGPGGGAGGGNRGGGRR